MLFTQHSVGTPIIDTSCGGAATLLQELVRLRSVVDKYQEVPELLEVAVATLTS